jgi:hypothetical protein
MATTFLKRQKEMKRLEKQREKAERRAQKKVAEKDGTTDTSDIASAAEMAALRAEFAGSSDSESQG